MRALSKEKLDLREYFKKSKNSTGPNETTEQTEARLARTKEYSKNSKNVTRQNETTEQREARLAKMREYSKDSKKEQCQVRPQKNEKLGMQKFVNGRELPENKLALQSRVKDNI